MRHFLASIVVTWAIAVSVLAGAACGSTTDASNLDARLDASNRRDGSPVEAPDGAPGDAAPPPGPVPTCDKYCDLVLASCVGDLAQYADKAECLGLCANLDPGAPGDVSTDSLSCRANYAGSPAKTDPAKYCLAAGPFGGGVCGDRCSTFCSLAVATCSPDGGAAMDGSAAAPYPSYPDCATACASYPFRDAGLDGGGEGPTGPAFGNTLNCRLYELRRVIRAGTGCDALGADSGACR